MLLILASNKPKNYPRFAVVIDPGNATPPVSTTPVKACIAGVTNNGEARFGLTVRHPIQKENLLLA
jgi:hypothetical protein